MRLRDNRILLGILAISISGALALSGCSNAQSPNPKASNAKSAKTAPPVAPDPEPRLEPLEPLEPLPIVLPADCDAMNATAAAEAAQARTNLGVTAATEPTNLDFFNQHAGPKAQATMAQAFQVTGCSYPVYLTNAVFQWVAEIPAHDQDALIESLRSSDYVESTVSDAMSFSYVEPADPNAFLAIDLRFTHLFIGNVWVVIIDSGELDYAPAAFAGVLAANPSLKV